MKREVKLGQIAYASPGDWFVFSPPERGKQYRFKVGPKNGRLEIHVFNRSTDACADFEINDPGNDHVECECSAEECSIFVHRVRTAFQFVVTRKRSRFMTWIRWLLGR